MPNDITPICAILIVGRKYLRIDIFQGKDAYVGPDGLNNPTAYFGGAIFRYFELVTLCTSMLDE